MKSMWRIMREKSQQRKNAIENPAHIVWGSTEIKPSSPRQIKSCAAGHIVWGSVDRHTSSSSKSSRCSMNSMPPLSIAARTADERQEAPSWNVLFVSSDESSAVGSGNSLSSARSKKDCALVQTRLAASSDTNIADMPKLQDSEDCTLTDESEERNMYDGALSDSRQVAASDFHVKGTRCRTRPPKPKRVQARQLAEMVFKAKNDANGTGTDDVFQRLWEEINDPLLYRYASNILRRMQAESL